MRISPIRTVSLLVAVASAVPVFAQAKAAPDTIVFTNGDRLTGTFTREDGGNVLFHSDIAGDITVGWAKIKELHSSQTVAVLKTGETPNRKTGIASIPTGTLSVEAGNIQLTQQGQTAEIAPIPVANAAYIVDRTTLEKQLVGHPGFFQGWNGSAGGGVTIVSATQNQYSVNATAAFVRTVPTVSWLNPRNKTSVAFNESFGKITQPAYTLPATATTAADVIPATYTKSNIFLATAERDEYMSPRFYYLGTASFNHDYSQSLQLMQIYGGGVGDTIIKNAKEELDLKAVAQYERQSFFNTDTSNENLIAATLSASYNRTLVKGIVFNQQVAYIPAFNDARAYAATEQDTLTFPAYKNFGFTIGTLDSYLNDTPITEPPTKRNSFQFQMNITYAIKSKY